MNAEEELVIYFQAGLNAGFVEHNLAKARENLLWCVQSLDENQCDVYRALAALDVDQPATVDQIEQIYKTLPHWGKLLHRCVSNGSRLPEDSLMIKVNVIPDLDINCSLRTRTAAYVGYASTLIRNGRYAEAFEVISASGSNTPIVELTKLYIYFKAQRFQDAIDIAQDILVPNRFDSYEREMGDTDLLIQAAAYLLSGISYAHLGNFVTAEDRLRRSDANNFVSIGAEACYHLGLIARATGDEDKAAVMFKSGLGYDSRHQRIAEAMEDPTIVLRQTTAELIAQRSSPWDVSTEADLAEIRETQRAEAQDNLLAEADAELTRQIGMSDVKEQVRHFKLDVAWAVEAARRGRDAGAKSLHMAFTGPPGTGKTTIARVVAKILCGLGLIKTDRIREVRRAELVGQVIGETEVKTNDVIDSALDGVLFIDEAYTLAVQDSKNDFGKVAIDTLLARMENERDRLVVIIAGYPNDIKMLLNTNDGLNSRISRRMDFSSYSPEEIGAIAGVLAEQRHSILPEASRELIVEETRALLMVSDSEGRRLLDIAGNGRFVRNVLESAEEFRSARHEGTNLQALSDDEFFSLMPADVGPALRKVIDPLLGRTRPTPPDAFGGMGEAGEL